MITLRKYAVAALALSASFAMPPAFAQATDKLKIGFISTFIGPGGILGQHMYDGFMLGVDHAGGRLGGMPTEIIKKDDQLKAEIGIQVAKEVLERDNVNFVSGLVFTNVLLPVQKIVNDAQVFLIGANSGPAIMAGENCNPFFFAASWQQDMTDEAMGRYLTQQGTKRVYAITYNNPAGRDSVASFKRTFKGEVMKEVYTSMDQTDYSVELAQLKASGVDSAYVFLPGGFGTNFLRQFFQAGLRDKVKLYGKSMIDSTTIGAMGDAAIGSKEFVHWNGEIDNPANKRFVADFEKKYKYAPSPYAEQGYDAAQLIDSAVKAVKGNLKDKDGIRKALRAANIQSPRGPFKYNRNHFPIQNEYLVEAVKGADGKPMIKPTGFVFRDVQDSHVGKCPMKW